MFIIKKLFKHSAITRLALLVSFISLSFTSYGQTLMPLPTHNTVYTGYARGFWFVAPTSFTITGVRVPSQAGSGAQYIQIVRLTTAPSTSTGSQSTNFTTLLYVNGAASGVITPTSLTINAGDIIGVLGSAGSTGQSNSYGTGSFTTSVYGSTFSIQRFGYQGYINSGATNQVWGVAQNGSGNVGRVELYYGLPCTAVSNIVVNSVSSTAASFSWQGVSGSVGYDYVVDQSATIAPTGTPVNVTATNGSASGLTPATRYYVHVRNYCSSTDKSAWDTASFETLPPCSEAQGVRTTSVDSNSANFVWNPLTTALSYLYVVDQSRNTPANNTGTVATIAAGTASGLQDGTKYYIHIKTYCMANDSSGWSLDSFYTPIACRAPIVSFNNINANRAVAYWPNMPSAVEYEYYTSTDPATPVLGSRTKSNDRHIPYLDANKKYYFHIRTHCSDRGVESASQWASYEFSTHALSIGGDVSEKRLVEIYPNPAEDELNIELNDKVSIGGTLEVLGVDGKVLKTKSVDQTGVTTIKLDGIAPGMYLLRFSNDSHRELTRFIKK